MSGEPSFIPIQRCTCGALVNAASGAQGQVVGPVPGDVSLCFACAKVWLFDDGLLQREPTQSELDDILSSEEGQIIFQLRAFVEDILRNS